MTFNAQIVETGIDACRLRNSKANCAKSGSRRKHHSASIGISGGQGDAMTAVNPEAPSLSRNSVRSPAKSWFWPIHIGVILNNRILRRLHRHSATRVPSKAVGCR
jgi:hypothetical protein